MRKCSSWLVAIFATLAFGLAAADEASAQRFGGFRGGFGGGHRGVSTPYGGRDVRGPGRGRDFGSFPRRQGPTRFSRDPGRYGRPGRDFGGRRHDNPYARRRDPYPPRGPVVTQVPGRLIDRHPPRHVVARHPRRPVFVAGPPPVPTWPRRHPSHVPPPDRLAGRKPGTPSQTPQTVAGPGGGTPTPAAAAPTRGAAFSVPAVEERRYVPNEVLITTAARIAPDRLRQVERRLGLTPLSSTHVNLLDVDIRRYRLSDNASVRGSIAALQSEPDIRAAQPNFLFELQDDTTDRQALATKNEIDKSKVPDNGSVEPPRPVQYAIDALKLEGAHQMATGANVLIAIIDTGLDETHPEIAGRIAGRFDAVGGTYRPHSHGTAMAGVIVAHKGLVGIAPNAQLLAIRAFESMATGSGQGTSYDIIRGLDFAADHRAQIVNMSFAGPHDELLAQALAKARTLGMIEIAAAGNAGPGAEPLYPGAEPGVIAVTATDSRNQLFAMANRGDYVAVAAPGVDIIAPSIGGAIQLTSGTSVAAAEASGVVALLLEAHPTMSADAVRKTLADTATVLPEQLGPPTELIDALAAVQATTH